MSKLDCFCSYTPVKVLGISLAISILVTITFFSIFGIWVGITSITVPCSILNSFLSITIALNLYRTIRDNFILSFLSFYGSLFIAPFIIMVIDELIIANPVTWMA